MRGVAQIAVKVCQRHICRNIFQCLFHIQHLLQAFAILQRLHQRKDFLSVGAVQIGFQVQPRVSGDVIPVIDQIRTGAAHALGLI